MKNPNALLPVSGLRHLKTLRPLLASLHGEHDHPNRSLHCDDLMMWLILSFFNPSLQSLRALQSASGSRPFQRRTGLDRFALASFSEALSVFDPEAVGRIFEDLAGQVHAQDAPPRPASLPKAIEVLAHDGSVWKALPRMARDFYAVPLTRSRKGELKGHFRFSVLRGAPVGVQLTPGSTDERHVLPQQLEANMLYLLDRGYLSRWLFEQITAARASFISRLKQDSVYEVLEERPLTAAARQAGVVADQRIRWQDQEFRLVTVVRRAPPPTNLHPRRKRGKHRAAPRTEGPEQRWLLITNRFDLSAEDVALLYTYRWHIEVFFRWLKCTLKCAHLFSESENGFALQMYAALIASLLVMLYTGRKPNKRLLETLSLYLVGWAEVADVRRVLKNCRPVKH
jgi:hypothetical protein